MKKVFTALFVACIFLTACERNAVKDMSSESNLETIIIVSAFEESVTVTDIEETTRQTSDNEYNDEIEHSEKTYHTIYLDIDNDGIIEKTEYINEGNKLIITKNDEILSEINLVDYGVSFMGIGMHSALYYFEYVSDYNDNIYLHIYTSYLIGDDPDGNRISRGTDSYYKLIDNKWNKSDYIHYSYSWDRQSPQSDIIYMEINGQETDSADYIIEKYYPIENTYYEIPY